MNVLIVEDDENLRVALADNLADEGYDVRAAKNCAEASRELDLREFDVVVLDLMLPDGDGYAICKSMREKRNKARVLMLTARSLEEDVVKGFDVGADDYLAKPYRLRELLARVRALGRRSNAPGDDALRFAGFTLDLAAHRLSDAQGKTIELTRTEFELLKELLTHTDRVLTRDELLDAVWGNEDVDAHTIDNFVSSLKKKLRWDEKSKFRIRTVRGVGYRMETE